ncbi:MAG: glycosyltransferase family 39 protein [Anaerolineae bacterium]|nr:glycosyltransferase family 39 protein [Anaerolineae bacterium]
MKAWLERRSGWILVVALLTGAGLRWLQIGAHGFWYDEALSALIARLSLTQILANAAASDHPPGYYLLLHFWLSLGQSEAAIRSLSALFSLGAVPLVYGLGRWLFGRSAAALAALGMALFPFQVYFAQEVRMYGVAVFLATALMWLFLYSVIFEGTWWSWVGYALVAACGLCVHYFIALLLIGLHFWFALGLRQHRAVVQPLLVADSAVALLFLPQARQALVRTGAYLDGVAWQASPSILSPLTTIYYLLFGHRAPIWLVPIGLFLTLAVLSLTLWEGRSRPEPGRRSEVALWFSLVIPIAIVMLISWLIRPIYLERSFTVTSPALVLLLARGATATPRRSPTPYLAALLAVPVIVTLVASVVTPDPARPPVREASRMVEAGFVSGDVSLHLQDASCMSALWYAPDVPHLLADVPGAAWTIASTHRLFGGDVVDWPSALAGANRLWLTVMPGYNGPEQVAVHQTIASTYPRLAMEDMGAVQLYLYDLQARSDSAMR